MSKAWSCSEGQARFAVLELLPSPGGAAPDEAFPGFHSQEDRAAASFTPKEAEEEALRQKAPHSPYHLRRCMHRTQGSFVLFIEQKQIAIGSFNPSNRVGFHRHLLLPHQNSDAGSELCTAEPEPEQPVARGKGCLTPAQHGETQAWPLRGLFTSCFISL